MASSNKLTFVNEALVASKTSDSSGLPAASSDFIAVMTVSVNDGATTVNGKIQHSPDNINWADIATFGAVVNVTSFEKINVVAPIFGNLRAVVTLAGTPSATVDVSMWYDSNRT